MGRPDGGVRVGDDIGSWRVIDYGDAGGFGLVYKVVRKDNPDVVAALKLCKFRKGVNFEHFIEERKNAGLVKDCKNVVHIHDGGKLYGFPYYIMDWCETFAGRLPWSKGGRIALGYFDACISLAEHGLLHGDIKPENVAVFKGEGTLIDLGTLCKIKVANVEAARSGTRYFRAPEVEYEGRCSEASDVYSLALTLFKILPLHLLIIHFIPLALAWQPFREFRPKTFRQFKRWYVAAPGLLKWSVWLLGGVWKMQIVTSAVARWALRTILVLLACWLIRVVILSLYCGSAIVAEGYVKAVKRYYAQTNEVAAFECSLKAARLPGFDNREVLLYLAHCYRTNNVVEPDEEEAKYYEDRANGRPAHRRPFWQRRKK